MTWFERLTFSETTSSQVRQNITVEGETLTSKVNGGMLLATLTLKTSGNH